MKMRVMHIVHQIGKSGGTELYVAGLANALRVQFDSTLVACQQGLSSQVCISEDRQVVRLIHTYKDVPALEMGSTPDGDAARVFSTASVSDKQTEAMLSEAARAIRPDLVHVHNLVGWPTLTLAFDVPYVVTIYDHFWICPDYFFVTSAFRSCQKSIADQKDAECVQCVDEKAARICSPPRDPSAKFLGERRIAMERLLQRAEKITTPSLYMAKKLLESRMSGGCPTEIIPFGSELAMLPRRRKPLQSFDGILRVAFVGHLVSHKGERVFVDVVKECVGLPIEFAVLGSVSRSSRLDLEARGVICYGEYPVSELPRLLDRVQLGMVLSRVDESYCIAVDDLLACGVPVIATAVGAIPERIADGVNGFLVPRDDCFSVCSILRCLVASPGLLSGMQLHLESGEVNSRCDSYERLGVIYQEILGGKRRVLVSDGPIPP